MQPKPSNSRFSARLGQKVVVSTADEKIEAFVPPKLPPTPEIETKTLYPLLDVANQSLGRLDEISAILPDTPFFLYMYLRKEALLSSQIEGTQSTLSDLLLYENKEPTNSLNDDLQEVFNYISAMNHGLARMQGDNFPLSSRLVCELHGILLSSGRGKNQMPGEFRRTQNWIGGTRPGNAQFVPPPHQEVPDLLTNLEKFIHESTPEIPALIKIGLVHAQFETIHPFLDGNGRLGRLLITFMLCHQGILREPMLYLSLYFKTHRQQYYDLLQQVRETGDWEAWLEFFLEGIIETSKQAIDTAHEIRSLFEKDEEKIKTLRQSSASAFRVHQLLQKNPYVTAGIAAEKTELSVPTTMKSIQHLKDIGILVEVTKSKRGQTFVYENYLNILKKGTEPL